MIPCYRCGREIDSPDASNADYVIAQDTVVREPVEVILALKHNQATLAKEAKMKETVPVYDVDGLTEIGRTPKYLGLTIKESEYDEVEIPNVMASRDLGEDLVRVKAEIREKDIQKTGIICPSCYKPTDTVIWGVHKKQG
ncbi:hypothetical protein ES703_123201 [subsurface metagenome]